MTKNSYASVVDALEHYSGMEKTTPPYVMFMAAKDEIEEALAAGWKATKIWQTMKLTGRINCGYSTFAHYISNYIRKTEDSPCCNSIHDNTMVPEDTPASSRSDSSQAVMPEITSNCDTEYIHALLRNITEEIACIKEHLNRCPIP